LQVLDAITIDVNAPSIKLLEKLGFHFERQIVLNEERLMLYRRTL
jgi:RimJ/RimL family protein N-acetyltransferase